MPQLDAPAYGPGTALRRLEAALEHAGSRRQGANSWTCPSHADSRASLSVGQGERGVTVRCHAGCATENVVETLGLRMRDLFDEPKLRAVDQPHVVERYPYTDEGGELLEEVERLMPKGFRQRRPDGRGGWSYHVGDVRRVPYRLPELIAAVECGDPVFIVEGEKDCDAVHAADWPATTWPGGAGGLKRALPELVEVFRRRPVDVTIIRDRDPAGEKCARELYTALQGIARSVRVVEAKVGKDFSDHVAAGLGVEDLVAVEVEAEPESTEQTEASEPDKSAVDDELRRRLAEAATAIAAWIDEDRCVRPVRLRAFLVPGLLAERVPALLSARGGAGKSFWLVELGISVATGGK